MFTRTSKPVLTAAVIGAALMTAATACEASNQPSATARKSDTTKPGQPNSATGVVPGHTRTAQAAQRPRRGIVGKMAPAWKVNRWFNLPAGKRRLDVTDFRGKVVYLFFFQSW